jgi:hypothetical protein
MDATTARTRTPRLRSANPELDYLLGQVAEDIQLSSTQYDKAKTHYGAVGDWLAAPGSSLADARPRLYPQGSMALGTTVSPWGRVEYDLDIVCEVAAGEWTAESLFNAVYDRLDEHETYRRLLTPSKPCARLEYRGDFHLDIIPAVRDVAGTMRVLIPAYSNTNVLVPTANLAEWSPSNPKGFVAWFRSRAVRLLLERLAKAHAEPLPAQTEVEDKPPLAIAVQLIKRARDVSFNGQALAPRSIVLTTLAGHHYTGGECVATIIIEVLRGIRADIRAAGRSVLQVLNPTNPGENFAEGMTPAGQEALGTFADTLGLQMESLLPARGIDLLQTLQQLFGEKPVATAVRKFGETHKVGRDTGALTYSPAGLGIVQPVGGVRVPKNTYFGE